MRAVILNNYVEADKMSMNDLISVYSMGFASGIMLSVIPLMIGEVISLAFKIMKGG